MLPAALAGAAAAALLAGGGGAGDLGGTFALDAVYEDGLVTVSFRDASGGTGRVAMEVLGMAESYRREFAGPSFTETVPFAGPPRHGWKAHPVVLEAEHAELGTVGLKTEIRNAGDPAPRTIYSRP